MIRPLEARDKGSYIALMRKFFDERISRSGIEFDENTASLQFDQFITMPDLIGFVAEDKDGIYGAIVGICSYVLFGRGICAQEMVWYVERNKRGRGLLLLREFEREAIKRGCNSIMMVGMDGDSSNIFYIDSGYIPMQTSYFKKVGV